MGSSNVAARSVITDSTSLPRMSLFLYLALSIYLAPAAAPANLSSRSLLHSLAHPAIMTVCTPSAPSVYYAAVASLLLVCVNSLGIMYVNLALPCSLRALLLLLHSLSNYLSLSLFVYIILLSSYLSLCYSYAFAY